jgi:histone-lysine N-methyltransferase SETD3
MCPDLFPLKDFSIESFEFCWYSILSRAYGRRLPYTAVVPLADAFNHSNVQSKYDLNVDGNGHFRVYPTGNHSITRGSEILISYGRWPNRDLLLDFGFALLENEWDRVSSIQSSIINGRFFIRQLLSFL